MKSKVVYAFLLAISYSIQISADNKLLKEGIHFESDTMALGKFIQLTVSAPTNLLLKTDKDVITKVEIKPANLNINYTIEGNCIQLKGVTPCKVAITINDDYAKPIFLFVNPPHPKVWKSLPKNTIRFKKGVHQIDKYIIDKDDVTLFLEDGAILKGAFFGNGIKNVKILGYGVIDGRITKQGVRFEKSENIEINGPIVLSRNGWTTSFFECNKLFVDNIKILSSDVYSDGIDLLATSNVLIDNIFIRNEDDCIAIKTKKYQFSGNVENIRIQNSVFWSGIKGNALEIGWELDGDFVRNIHFENIDIIRKETSSYKFKRAAISIHHVGNCKISDILYKNIRIESVFENLIWFELISANKWGSGGGSIDNVRFENVEYLKGNDAQIVINGGATGLIKNIEFKDLKYKGKSIVSTTGELFKIDNVEVKVK
jgi:hypothetical protein